MFRFLHTADIHLDSPLRGLEVHEDAPVDSIRGATRRAFDNLINLAVEERVEFVVISGDLYDGDWKDYNTGLFFAARMGRLNRAGIKVFIVSGNHDAASQITRAMPLPENVYLFSAGKPQSVKLQEIGVAIHGQSYAARAVTENLVLHYPLADPHSFNIGLLHSSLTGREGHENYAPCSLDDLKSRGYGYWALGHVHKREIVSEDPWIVFPGNIQGRHIRETGPKGAALITVEDGHIAAVEERDLDVLRWSLSQLDLSGYENSDSVYAAVRKTLEQELDLAGGNPLGLRLVLTGESPVHTQLLDHKAQWTEEFQGIAASLGDVWLERVVFRTRRKLHLDSVVSEDTPVAGLLRSIKNLELDSDTLSRLVPELSALKSKLPVEIHTMEEPFLDSSPVQIEELREEVEELLISRLLRHGESK